jgi:hypothetical protein
VRPKRAIIEITCSGETHRIEVSGVKARMLNHDETMVEAFTEFGAEAPECLRFVRYWKLDPLEAAMTLAPPCDEATHLVCGNCGWKGSKHGVRTLEELYVSHRLEPGCIVPYGECPQCGAFVYLGFGPWEPE